MEHLILLGLISSFCFVQMMHTQISPIIILIILMGQLIVYFYLEIKKDASYYFIGQSFLTVGMIVGSLVIHPSIGFISVYLLVRHYKGYKAKSVPIVLVLMSLYSWYSQGILQNEEVWIGIATIIFFVIQMQRGKEQLKVSERCNSELRESLNMTKHKLESLSKYNVQIEYATKISERNQIAQRLHDQLGHTLAGNIMRLEVAKLLIDKDSEQSKQVVADVTDSLRIGMDNIRTILKELKPQQSEVGLHTLKQMLTELQNQTGIQTQIYYEGNIAEINIVRWQVITENLIETLTNVQKHSCADQFIVRIYQFNKVLKVQFKDNGLVQGDLRKSLGLRGIEERTIGSGGRVIYQMEDGFETLMIWEGKN